MEDLDARSRLILDAHFRGMALEFVVRRIVRDLEAVVPGITDRAFAPAVLPDASEDWAAKINDHLTELREALRTSPPAAS